MPLALPGYFDSRIVYYIYMYYYIARIVVRVRPWNLCTRVCMYTGVWEAKIPESSVYIEEARVCCLRDVSFLGNDG